MTLTPLIFAQGLSAAVGAMPTALNLSLVGSLDLHVAIGGPDVHPVIAAIEIRAFTMGGAHDLLKENEIGSIEVGKYADMIVLNHNLLEIPNDDISETQVLKTVFNGKVVYEAE